jgi:hypothetical protein
VLNIPILTNWVFGAVQRDTFQISRNGKNVFVYLRVFNAF